MFSSRNVVDILFAELCKADPAESVLVLPPGGNNLRQRICAADRMALMQFAQDLYQRTNTSAIRREVDSISVFYTFMHLTVL